MRIQFLEHVFLERAEKLSKVRAQNPKPARQGKISFVGPATALLRSDYTTIFVGKVVVFVA